MNEDQPCKATPKDEIERKVMNVNTPKSEVEWWAYYEITALREGVRQIGAQWTKCQDVIAAQDVFIREMMAEIKRLKAS